MCWALLLQEAHAMQAIRHSMHSRHFAPQNKEDSHGKKRRFPGRYAGQHEQPYETGAENAASDEEAQKELEEKEITAAAGGGAVEVTVSGSKKILKVKLDEEVVDPDDVEMLEDLLVAAVNEALEKVDAETTSAMSKFTGGMGGGMPGLF